MLTGNILLAWRLRNPWIILMISVLSLPVLIFGFLDFYKYATFYLTNSFTLLDHYTYPEFISLIILLPIVPISFFCLVFGSMGLSGERTIESEILWKKDIT